MGPKKKGEVPSNKVQKKEQNRVIEDKTFGLKNKNKSKVVQKYVTAIQILVSFLISSRRIFSTAAFDPLFFWWLFFYCGGLLVR